MAWSGRLSLTPPTLADVAERAGVSRQTVSNAVNNPELLRPDTLSRVQDAISRARLLAEPGRPQPAHARLSPDRPEVQPGPGGHGERRDGPLRALPRRDRRGQRVPRAAVLGDGRGRPVGGYDDLLRSTAVDAFIVTDTYLGNPQAAWLTQRRAPFVAFGRPWDNPDATHAWVDVDGAAGTELATDHLLDKGHTRIAWIGWRKDSFIGEDRRSGWARAMHARDLPTTGLASRVEDTVASGREAATVLLDEAQPSAFVCASDTLAMGVLHALGDRGIHWGKDVAVVGFDDSQVAQVVPGGLTSVRQPLEQVAVELVKALEGLLSTPPVAGPGVLLTPTLAVRLSSG